jgi:hypothetical protein
VDAGGGRAPQRAVARRTAPRREGRSVGNASGVSPSRHERTSAGPESWAPRFANETRLTGLFEYSRPFLHAAFVNDLRMRSRDVDPVWWLAAFALAAGIVHALRAGLEHEPGPGA